MFAKHTTASGHIDRNDRKYWTVLAERLETAVKVVLCLLCGRTRDAESRALLLLEMSQSVTSARAILAQVRLLTFLSVKKESSRPISLFQFRSRLLDKRIIRRQVKNMPEYNRLSWGDLITFAGTVVRPNAPVLVIDCSCQRVKAGALVSGHQGERRTGEEVLLR